MPRDILKFPCGKGPWVERVEATWSRTCWAHHPKTTDPPWVQMERERVSSGTRRPWQPHSGSRTSTNCLKVSDPPGGSDLHPSEYSEDPAVAWKQAACLPWGISVRCSGCWLHSPVLPGTVKVRVCPVQWCPFLCLPFPHPSFPVVTVRRRGLWEDEVAELQDGVSALQKGLWRVFSSTSAIWRKQLGPHWDLTPGASWSLTSSLHPARRNWVLSSSARRTQTDHRTKLWETGTCHLNRTRCGHH